MIVSGTTITSPGSGEAITFRTTAVDSEGGLLAFDFSLAPGGQVATPHQHPRREERICVSSGVALVEVAGERRLVHPGEVLVIPPGTAHRIAHHGSASEPLIGQVEFRPAGRVAEFLDEVFALDRAGRTNARGQLPMLQAAVTTAGHFDDMALPAPPLLLQKALLTALRPVAHLRGYRRRYPSALTT
jgi:quercetin dioxygenase-like cupin family protein